MTIRPLRSRIAPLLPVVLALFIPATLFADTTFTFQNGANTYAGAADVSINTQYAQYNGGNGIQWRGDPELGCYTTTGADAYSVRYLLKFAGLSVPAGSVVVSASLTMALDSWNDGGGNISGFYLRNSWNPASSRIGWLHRDSTSDWAAGGASSVGIDTVAGKSFRVPPLRPIGPQSVTIPLDLAVVQSWIDSPGSNQGVMLVNNIPGDIVRPISTVGTKSQRPKLTIVVSGAPPIQVTLSPTAATLQPGQTQQFTANTAVTWTATGGTISTTGLFTAGAAAGSFSVKATSTADPTKSATASITVQPPVQVTLSPTAATLQPGQTQQFTANTAVTWTATGGTISTTGLFTAGAAAGSFSVKATSTADPTKSATASITVQQPMQVTLFPTAASLQPGQTQQFTANTAVTWTATGGTISTTGLFTAGAAAGSFSVKATSTADPTKSATASITVQPPIQVTLSPTAATLQPGQTQQFTANTAVTWTATGGTISTTGLFTAGAAAGSFSVKATSTADPTKFAIASITVQQPMQVTLFPTAASLQPGQTQQFTANTAVTWTATGGTISTTGLYTAGAAAGNFAITATSSADPTKSATASIAINSTQSLPPVPRQSDGPYVVIQSPVSGMHFTAPATIRIYADPYDGNAPDPDALTVAFLIDGASAGTYTGSGTQNGYFALTVNSLPAGAHTITAQLTPLGHAAVTSAPVRIFVDNPPVSTGPVFNLTADVVLSGTQSTTYAGTAANPCAIVGNGFQIRSAAGFAGSLNISNCAIRGLGTSTKPAVDVAVNGAGSLQLTGNVFETFGTVSVAANDQAQLAIRGNEFRENTLVPVGSQPEDVSPLTLPVLIAAGNSTAQKFFQGNNVGLSTVVFHDTRNWLIGGNTAADSNVLIGVRCGFRISRSSNMVLRGNYSQHNYPHRFSQGENFQLDGDGFLAEHNVIRSSSWPVRGMGGELRYNLIDASGNSDQVFQAPMSNSNIHHNIFSFTVSQTLYSPSAGLSLIYNVDHIQFHNNTMDGGGRYMSFDGPPISVTAGSFLGSFHNNVIYNYAGTGGRPVLSGDYNESTNPPRPGCAIPTTTISTTPMLPTRPTTDWASSASPPAPRVMACMISAVSTDT